MLQKHIGTYDYWIVKVSENGEMIWAKNFGGTQIENFYAGASTNDGNFFLFGDTRSNDVDVSSEFGNADIWGAKIDENGDLLTQQSYGGSEFETAQHITSLSNGNYLITGNTRSTDGDFTENNGQNDALIMVIDSNESLQFQLTVGGSEFDFSRDAIEDNDNALVIAGSTQSNDKDIPQNKGVEDVLIIKLK